MCLGSPLVDSATGRRLQQLPAGKILVGQCLAQVLAQPLADWQGQRQIGVIAGSRNMGLGRLIRHTQEAGDGTVSVRETRLPGIADHLVLELSHSGLVLSREAAGQTDFFLSHGHFSRP